MSGRLLLAERRRRNLTLDDVAEGARIPRRYLVALEEDDTATLPPGPFLRSYRRQYLMWLGLDPDAWQTQHAIQDGDDPNALSPIGGTPGGPDEATATATIPRIDELPVFRLVVLGFLLTLAVVLALRVGSRVVDPADAQPEPTPVTTNASQTVSVRAVEPTNVKLETDSSFHHNGTLQAGKAVSVESALPVTVEVADLTHVVIHHNGDRIEPLHNLSAARRLVFIPE